MTRTSKHVLGPWVSRLLVGLAAVTICGNAHADKFDLRCEGKMSDGIKPKIVLVKINTESPVAHVSQSTIESTALGAGQYLPITQTPELFHLRDSALVKINLTIDYFINRSTGILSKGKNGTPDGDWALQCVKGEYTGPQQQF